MDSLYSRFIGVGLQNKNSTIRNYGLSKSSSMPFYQSFQARKLPANLSVEIPFKKRKEGITSSDIKVQMLEEKIRNLEDKQMKMIQTFNQNNDNKVNDELPDIQPNIMPVPLLILNNNDFQNYNNSMSKKNAINNELQKSRLKFERYRGLQKQDYTPNIERYSENNMRPNYKSIFYRQNHYKTSSNPSKQNQIKVKEEINNMKIRNNARKFVDELDREIYSPILNDFEDYMNNVNQNIQQQLNEDNILLNQDIETLENDFKEIKTTIKEKLKLMEKRQKSKFENLKNVIRNVGGRKMSKAIQNVFEGQNYDLQKAEEEYLVNDVLHLPDLINKKISEEELMNIEKEKKLQMKIEQKMNEEFERRRLIEEEKHRKRLELMEIEREKERVENLKKINMLKYQIEKENEDNYFNYINNINKIEPFYPKIVNNELSLSDISKLFFMKKIKNMNIKNGVRMPFNMENINDLDTDEMLRYMLLKKMGIDNNMNNMNNLNYLYQGNNYNNMNNSVLNNANNLNNNNNNNNKNNEDEEKKSIIKDKTSKDENIKSRFSTLDSKKRKMKKSSKKSKSKSKISTLKISKKSSSETKKTQSSKTSNKSKKSDNKSDSKDKTDESEDDDEEGKKKEKDKTNEDEEEDDEEEEEEEDDDDEN